MLFSSRQGLTTRDVLNTFINPIEECVKDDTGNINHVVAILGTQKEAETEGEENPRCFIKHSEAFVEF
jgi:hypothetical protein